MVVCLVEGPQNRRKVGSLIVLRTYCHGLTCQIVPFDFKRTRDADLNLYIGLAVDVEHGESDFVSDLIFLFFLVFEEIADKGAKVGGGWKVQSIGKELIFLNVLFLTEKRVDGGNLVDGDQVRFIQGARIRP